MFSGPTSLDYNTLLMHDAKILALDNYTIFLINLENHYHLDLWFHRNCNHLSFLKAVFVLMETDFLSVSLHID